MIVGAVILWSLRAWSSVPSSLTGAASGHLLLAIAHPDDESMFFVPTVRAFIAAGWRVSIACLSNGETLATQCPTSSMDKCSIQRLQWLLQVAGEALPQFEQRSWCELPVF